MSLKSLYLPSLFEFDRALNLLHSNPRMRVWWSFSPSNGKQPNSYYATGMRIGNEGEQPPTEYTQLVELRRHYPDTKASRVWDCSKPPVEPLLSAHSAVIKVSAYIAWSRSKLRVDAWLHRPNHPPIPLDIITFQGQGDGIKIPTITAPASVRKQLRDALTYPIITEYDKELFSRIIEAMGIRSWHIFRSTAFAIIGCGRSGALLARQLASLGARHLTLIDHDILEPHNAIMAGIPLSMTGKHKVHALFDTLLQSYPCISIKPIATGIHTDRGMEAAIDADILIICVDVPLARLIAGAIGVLFDKPHLDIGVRYGGSNWAGADVRFIVPGQGCLLCLGGVQITNEQREALKEVAHSSEMLQSLLRPSPQAGRLLPLNAIAVGWGLSLLLNHFIEPRKVSQWVHLPVYPVEDTSPSRITSATRWRTCPLCRLAGSRGEVLNKLPDVLQDAQRYEDNIDRRIDEIFSEIFRLFDEA